MLGRRLGGLRLAAQGVVDRATWLPPQRAHLNSSAFTPYRVLANRNVSPTAHVLTLAVGLDEPLGGHERSAPTGVKARHPESGVEKSYSPISHPAQIGSFDLLVRGYPPRPGGGLGAYLCSLSPGEVAPLRVKPREFGLIAGKPLAPARWDHIGLIAGGTGLAPLLQVARQVLDGPSDSTQVSLLFVSRQEDEIFLRGELEAMAAAHPTRFKLHLAVTRPEPGAWSGVLGRPTEEILRRCMPGPCSRNVVLVCGSDGFLETVAGGLRRVKLPDGSKRKEQGPIGGLLARLGFEAQMVHKL